MSILRRALPIAILAAALQIATPCLGRTPAPTFSSPLHEAITVRDLGKIDLLLRSGANPNLHSPLQFLLQSQFYDAGGSQFVTAAAKLLVDAGANFREPGLLRLVARDGGEQLLTLLLQRGLTVDSEPIGQGTALHIAAHSGAAEAVAIMLKHGANPDSEDGEGCKPLHHAFNATKNTVDIMRLLVQGGAKMNATCKGQDSSLAMRFVRQYRGSENDIAAIFELFSARKIDICSAASPISGMFRDSGTKTEMARQLLSRCAADAKALSLLLLQSRDLAQIRELSDALIKKGAPLNAKGQIQDVQFLAAVVNPAVPIWFIEELIEKGMDINATTDAGDTALHRLAYASRSDRFELASMLIARGLDVNAATKSGATPLIRSAFTGRVDSINFFLSKGADIHKRGESGFTALHYAARENSHGLAMVRLLIERGADPNSTTEYGFTPLHAALQIGINTATAELLLQKGANPNARSREGKLPIHQMALFPNRKTEIHATLGIFCQSGFDILSPDRSGLTILDYAKQRGFGETATLIETMAASPQCQRRR